MIIPSIDLMDGKAVQLVGGREKALERDDVLAVAQEFAVAGELAVVDLDAALGRGSNEALVRELCRRHPCRVGGGIRDAEAALRWLDAGATKVVLGTAAVPEVLSQLPRERVVAALDCVDGEVVVDGWRRRTGEDVLSRAAALKDLVGGVLVTFVEREGRLNGTSLERAAAVVRAAGGVPVTIAGGVSTVAEVAALDRLGADAQVGMALYTGRFDPGEAVAACVRAEPPWPTVVVDEGGRALGLAWSDAESLAKAMRARRGIYRSRRRGLWVKGETSGDRQDLLRVDLDCDRDALRFTVRQHGTGFCHRKTRSCWGEDAGLALLERRLLDRAASPTGGSYTRRLLDDPELLASKLAEEAAELGRAATPDEIRCEAADILYFTLVTLVRAGVSCADVETELDRRSRRVTRRGGDRKEVRS